MLTLLISLVCAGSFAQTKKTVPAKPAATKQVAEPKKLTEPKKEVTPVMDQAEIDKKWAEFATPGEEHAKLASYEGEWKSEIKMWMQPDAGPSVNMASCAIRMILDGRYQEAVTQGDFNGMPFQGISITGYDNTLKKYVSTWIDNMGTGIIMSTGTYNPKLGAIEFIGEQTDPVSGKMMKVRELYFVKDVNEHYIEMYNTPHGGKEYKSMEIRMSR